MSFSAILLCLVSTTLAWAELYVRPEAALELKYGVGQQVQKINVALNPEQFEQVKKLSKTPITEKIYTLYNVKSKEGQLIGGAVLLTDMVRTHNQTVLYFLSPEGKLTGAELIAYYEPPEYKIANSWMNENLGGKDLKNPLASGDDLPIVTGSTLTVQSIARTSRLALALWQVTSSASTRSQP